MKIAIIDHGDDSFVLNGITYAPIKKQRRHYSSRLNSIITTASMLCPDIVYGINQYSRELPKDTDIIKEYGLIQNKQSSLSKWERDMVVKIFESNFYRISL